MEKIIHVAHQKTLMEGMLKIPDQPQGIVVFAHGSDSSRFSPRNNFVANILYDAGLATLLIDLLAIEEGAVYQKRFDIHLLTDRLAAIIHWIKNQSETKALPIGLFGASTGAAAALHAASQMSNDVKAVVSRGGRPDLAIDILPNVAAPTLFIVGGNDFEVLRLNQKAYELLTAIKHFEIVPNATHLFEEAGCLDQVALLARQWFIQHLTANTSA